MSKENIAVIGAGPLALVTVLELQKYTNRITLIYPAQNRPEKSKKAFLNFKIIQKDRSTKRLAYSAFNGPLKVSQKNTNFLETSAFGGLSNLWGGVCFPQTIRESRFNYIESKEKLEIESYLVKLLNISNSKSQLWQYFRFDKASKKVISGPPSIARDKKGTWSAVNQLQRLKGIKVVEGEVISIKKVISKIGIKILIENHNQIMSFDRVFVACGPIGDAKIVINSLPKISRIQIYDSRTEYQLLLKRTKHNQFKKLMIPSKCVYFMKQNGFVRCYAQIYPLSQQLIESLPIIRINPITKNLMKFLSKFLHAAIIFYPTDQSKSFIIEKTENGFKSYTGKGPWRRNVFKARENMSNEDFKSIGYNPIFIRFKNKPGSGVHSGSFLFESNFDYGRIPGHARDLPNLHFVGSSTLPSIPTGPITLSALTNGIYIVRKVFKDLVK